MPRPTELPDRPVRVLLVDDDREDYLLTRDLLSDIPGDRFHLHWVSSYEEGKKAICSGEYDVHLLDYRLGEHTGLDLLEELNSIGCHGPVILLTGQGEFEIDQAAMKAGAADFLEKGRLDAILLERAIRYAIQQHGYEAQLEREVQARTRQLQLEITERKRAEELLKETDRRKDEFLATLAHELRNPLAPIRNALEIMRLAGSNVESVEKARAMMERQVAQMVRLIDDLLDVSRITTGKLRLTIEPLQFSEILTAALEISQPLIEKARHTLTVHAPAKDVKLYGDRVRLAQVFSNLLNNAAKYTEAGGTLSLNAEQTDSSITVRVKDTGVGIPPELLPHLFDLFTQVDRTLNRSQGGLGIGLALVRRLIEMHGGTVNAKSDGPGKGTEFTVVIPLNSPDFQPPGSPTS
jgi:signal transduction histidine kinase